MRIIKLDAIDSTNSFLKEISSAEVVEDFTVVSAKSQTNGRGQMGALWQSQKDKNLTFSVFKEVSNIKVESQFYISIVTSLALVKTLEDFNVPKISVKWPNDILSADKKICGVLIENVIKHSKLNSSVIGVGLNVNQSDFGGLPRASSMLLILGNTFDLDEILQSFIKHLKVYFEILESEKTDALLLEYNQKLFRKNKPSTFKNTEGSLFSGFIKGVSSNGNLIVQLEDNIIKEFSLKEISLLY